MQYRRGALLFTKAIHQISRSHGTKKNRQFWPELSVSGLRLQFEFTDGFEMMHKAWCSIEEVPCYFSRSSIKFQGHTGWKIDGFDQIWARLLGRSQLSNPSDLPCYQENVVCNNAAILSQLQCHIKDIGEVIETFSHYWPLCRGIHQSDVYLLKGGQ